jgi:hypothetical protein
MLLLNDKVDLDPELNSSGLILEECVLNLIKISMEISYIPIKKCIIIFYRYLEL